MDDMVNFHSSWLGTSRPSLLAFRAPCDFQDAPVVFKEVSLKTTRLMRQTYRKPYNCRSYINPMKTIVS